MFSTQQVVDAREYLRPQTRRTTTSAMPAKSTTPSPRDARFALTVLTAMNLLNYLDRWVPSAVKDLFKADLDMTDAQTSLPTFAFVVVYMLASPVFGGVADRFSRRWLIAAGVALWSLATAFAAAAQGFVVFLIARALVGIGEAAYATISPSLIGDFYAPAARNRALTIFYVAIPVGSALGFTLGGLIGAHYGWRAAFLICGLPGLLAAGLALRIKEPPRGGMDDAPLSASPPSWPDALKALAKNRLFVVTVAGYTLVTFASGGMADWFPTFLSRYRGLGVDEAGSLVGTTVVAGGLGGTIVGGWLGDRLQKVTRQPYLALSAWAMLPATLFGFLAITLHGTRTIAACLFLCQFFMWFYNGPVNTILVNCTDASMRARAFSVSILAIHLLGDAISPLIMGAISDATGNLWNGVVLAPITLALGMLIWAYGWRRI